MPILIRGALVVDGTRKSAVKADILVEGERIARIAPDIAPPPDVKIIDAAGLAAAPGFIDTHSHSDLKVLVEPALEPKLRQGITTEVLGQDGISMAPLPVQYIAPWRKNLAGLDGESDSINWEYETAGAYLDMVAAAKPALNEAYLAPHGNLRMEAMGLGNREPTPEELKRMCAVLRREMEAGCIGLSSGLIYMPCAYSDTEEVIALCRVVAEYDGVFVVHQRSEADDIINSMEEIIRVGAESGVRIHFSHFKVCGKDNWEKIPRMFALLDEARAKGIRVSLDQYPYVAGSTMLGVILPPWVHDGGTDAVVERLRDPAARERMKRDIENGIPGWDNFVRFAGTAGIFITSVGSKKNSDAVGLSLDQLAEKRGTDPLSAAFDLLAEEENAVGMVDFYGTEEHVALIMGRDEMNVCTDGLLSGKPHPRVYGSFPRVLGKYVREDRVLSLEDAVWKMTGKAAESMGFTERGILAEGNFADIVLFDPAAVADRGTFTDPAQFPQGIHTVLVNGEAALLDGKPTGARAGRVLKKTVALPRSN